MDTSEEKQEKSQLHAAFSAAENSGLLGKEIAENCGWTQSAYSQFKSTRHARPEKRAQAITWLKSQGFWPPPAVADAPILREAIHAYVARSTLPDPPREIAYRLGTDDIMTTILRARELGDEKRLSRLFDLVSHVRLIETNCLGLIEELGSVEAAHRVIQTEIANDLQRRRKSDPENVPRTPGHCRTDEPEL